MVRYNILVERFSMPRSEYLLPIAANFFQSSPLLSRKIDILSSIFRNVLLCIPEDSKIEEIPDIIN